MPFKPLRNGQEDVAGGDGVDEIEEDRNPFGPVGNVEADDEKKGAEAVEQEVRNGRLFRHAVRRKRGEEHGDRCSDVGAEQQRKRGVEVEQSARSKREHDADHRRAGLDQEGPDDADQGRSEHRADRHEAARGDGGAVERTEKTDESREAAERFELGTHQSHAEEEQSESEDRFAPSADCGFFRDHHQEADRHARQGDSAEVERNQLRGHGRSDVRSEDDADCLLKREKSGIDEADNHDGGCGARLNDRRHHGSCEHGDNAVAGEELEDALHVFSGDLEQPVRHEFHPEDEEGESADDGNDDRDEVEPEDADLACAEIVSAFRVGDFDADAVFSGVLAETDLSGGHAAGVG